MRCVQFAEATWASQKKSWSHCWNHLSKWKTKLPSSRPYREHSTANTSVSGQPLRKPPSDLEEYSHGFRLLRTGQRKNAKSNIRNLGFLDFWEGSNPTSKCLNESGQIASCRAKSTG